LYWGFAVGLPMVGVKIFGSATRRGIPVTK
jgi:hypothetical protein